MVNDIDNDDELSVVFAVVDESDPPDLNVPLERLQNQLKKHRNQEQFEEQRLEKKIVQPAVDSWLLEEKTKDGNAHHLQAVGFLREGRRA